MRLKTNIFYLVRYFPFVLFVLNFVTKLLYLTSEEIALDEPFSVYHAQFPVPVLIGILKGYNNPPLYEIILHYWIRLFGISPLSVRFLPMIIACLSPIVLFYFAKRNFSLKVAVASSLLLTFSYLLLYYSHDCRAYTLFLLLAILSVHYYLETVLVGRRTTGKIVLFLLFTTLLIYTHYFGFFLIFFQGLHLLIFFRKRIPAFVLFYALILAAYLPHFYPFLTRAGDSVSQGTWIEIPTIEGLYNSLWAFSNFPFITVGCIILLVCALIKFIRRPQTAENFHVSALVIFWFAFAYLGMFILSFWVPMYINRYLIYALPAYYITINLCIIYLFKNTKVQFAIMAMFVLSFICTLDYNPDKKQPVAAAIKLVKEHRTQNTTLLVYPYDFIPVFTYNYNRHIFSQVSDNKQFYKMDSLLRSENIFHIHGAEDLRDYEAALKSEVLYFALGEHRNKDTDPVFKKLSGSFKLKWQKRIGANWFVTLFEKHTSTS